MRAASLTGVSVSLLRHHVSLYVGCGVVIAAASLISSAELVLFQALVVGDGISWGEYTDIEAMQLRRQLEGLRVILVLMFLSAVAIALFLVFTGVRDLIMHRQRELGLLRLVGARQSHVRRLVAVETVAFSFLVALPSAVLGHVLAGPFYKGLQAIGVFGEQLRLVVGVYPLVVAGIVALISALSGFAAWLATKDITSRPLLESIEATAGPAAPKRRLLVRLAVLAGCVAVVLLLGPGQEGAVGQLALLVPLLIAVPLTALAPYIVPVAAALVSRLLRFAVPGLTLLVRQRARRDADRFVSTIMPIVLAIGLLSGFYLGNAPDEALRAREYNDLLKSDLVASTDTAAAAGAVLQESAQLEATAARFGESRSIAELDEGRKKWAGTFYFTDFQHLADLFAFRVIEGNLAAVGKTSVASSRSDDHVGDLIEVSGTSGTMRLRVAAVIDSELYEGLFSPWDLSSQLGVTPQNTRVFLKTSATTDQVLAALEPPVSNQVRIIDRTAFIDQQIETRRSNTSRSNIALFGTIYAMTVVSLLQSATTSGTSRRREFGLYRSLGLRARSIVAIVAVESIVLAIVSALLLAVAIAAMYWRFIGSLPTSTGTVSFIPWGLIGTAFGTAVALMLLASVGGTIYSLKVIGRGSATDLSS